MIRPDFFEALPAEEPRKSTSLFITKYFERKWDEAGVANRHFKPTHCFRSYGETKLQRAAKDVFFVKKLKGDSIEVDEAYYGPSEEELALDYAANMHVLYIDEKYQALERAEAAEAEKEKLSEVVNVQLLIEQNKRRELEDRVKAFEEKISKSLKRARALGSQ